MFPDETSLTVADGDGEEERRRGGGGGCRAMNTDVGIGVLIGQKTANSEPLFSLRMISPIAHLAEKTIPKNVQKSGGHVPSSTTIPKEEYRNGASTYDGKAVHTFAELQFVEHRRLAYDNNDNESQQRDLSFLLCRQEHSMRQTTTALQPRLTNASL